ncbi:minor capsid protein [Amycolatopsis kentuckyensis]|uniref:minor capsid protein n=1 Tax=Amycolatopsis kentuckyensis TaxID=218823 RepID=UPI000A3C0E73|nr:minor capsid protein [Amycolatopsis kentuckyensis]
MSFTGDLLDGLAAYLAAAGAGAYRGDGSAYLPGETAIVFAAMPQTPDRAIVLSDYPVTDDPSLSDSRIGVQVKCRGGTNPHDVKAISDAVFDVLHGKTAFNLGPVRVVQALRNSGVPLGRDDSNRWEHSDNYYLTVHRPSANRT